MKRAFDAPRTTPGDRAVVAYSQWLLRWRWPVIALSIAVAVLTGYGSQLLSFNNNYRVFFSADNPQRTAFEAIQDTYTRNDGILFAVTPATGVVFESGVLTAVAQLTEISWQLPYALRVDSVTNFPHIRVDEDDLIVTDLVPDAQAMSIDQIAQAREIALAEPALRNRLISDDASVTGVFVTFQLPDPAQDSAASQKAGIELVAQARLIAAQVENDYPDIDIRLTGSVMMNNTFLESSISDLKTLIPLMYAGIVITMLLLVRCISSTLATVVVIAFSIVTAMGLAGWAGIKLTSPSATAPTVILTLAVADCVHVIVSMFAAMRHGVDKRSAIVESLRINMQPVFLTSATTAIGFLTMNFSDVPPFRDLGNITAVGVIAAFFYAVVLLPAVLAVLPCRSRRTSGALSGYMDRLADLVVRRHKPLLIGTTLVSVAVLAFVPVNELDDEFVKYFGERIEFRRDTDYTVANLTGINQIHYSLPAGDSNGVSDPEFLARLERFADWYRNQPEVIHVNTIGDTFKRLNRVLHGDDPAWYRVPERRDLAAQYLLLYELSLPFGLDLNNQLNIDKSATQFVATVGSLSSVQLRRLVARSEAWLTENSPQIATTGIGISVMFSHISDRNIRTMIRSATLGLLAISALILLALRSVRIGMLSLIPNLLPIGLAFGIWGMFVGQINVAASVVSGLILGIIVDDTVHFLSKYLRARRERGLQPPDAVRYAFHTVGTALLVTTLILVAGFTLLSLSQFEINATMGALTAIGIALALIIDFLLLPPLLIRLDRKHYQTTHPTGSGEDTIYAPT